MSLPPSLTAYRLAMQLAAPLAPSVLKRRAKAGKEDLSRLNERLGRPKAHRPDGVLVWLHGASVGESLVLATLVEELGGIRPDLNFLVTTGTCTSADLMQRRLPSNARHQYVPVDTAAAATGFLDHWKPDLAVFAESELWPNLIVETARRGVPMALVNARMNARSLRNWRRRPDTARWLLACFDWIGAADQRTRDGLEDLTGSAVTLAGNLKLEAIPAPPDPHELSRIKVALAGREVWLAASTHDGEDGIALSANAMLKSEHPNTLLILAPRHPERAGEIERLLQRHKHKWARRSKHEVPTSEDDVWLADTLGEMALWFAVAPAALIAGSLKPDIGGHNPIEATQAGCAVLSGRHVASFQDVYDAYSAHEAVRWVEDAVDTSEAVADIWAHRGPKLEQARAALSAAAGGALATTVTALIALLEPEEAE
ncbi:3-deoxy-D-manno-octulosonic acid transferase [Maricaulis sp.]|uniref:3-deoxy-D-manno-octulosonic acid transferase n=1 Tax=Maricaulis sp. TaxID=1486257 RepID=UPI00261616D6|nr:3-deoxy-D-manno-octulosonic acid transferase [Maricaulis sp.]